MSKKSLEEQLAEARAEVAKARAELASIRAPKPLTYKVSQKGAVSVYGLQRFPITLYASQWERLEKEIGKVVAFIASNPEGLVRKETEAKTEAEAKTETEAKTEAKTEATEAQA